MQLFLTVVCLLSYVCVFINAEEILGTASIISSGLEKRTNIATWYSGSSLDNAACFDRKKLPSFTPKSTDMVGAMAMSKFEQCYKCMKIKNLANKKTVTVQIVDICGSGCAKNHHIDLTPGAFLKIGDLNTGILKISFKRVKCPTSGSTFTKIRKMLKKAGVSFY